MGECEMKRELNAQQRRFIEEYLVDLNATQAAIRAGYSKKTARSQGQRFLTREDVQEELQAAMAERSRRVEIDQDRVLKEEATIAFSDLRQLFLEDGTMVAPSELPEEVARAVAGFEIIETFDKDGNKTVKYKYRLWDKGRSLERIGKHLGMYVERKEIDFTDGGFEIKIVEDKD